MKLKINRNYINIICEYVFVIIIICGNYSMLTRDIAWGISEVTLVIFFCLANIMVIFLCKKKNKISEKRLFDYLFLIVTSILVVIAPGANIKEAFVYWLIPVVCCGLCFLLKKEKKDILIRYVNVVVILAIVSMFFYILGSVLDFISPSRTAMFFYDGKYKTCNTYYGLLYEAQKMQGQKFFSLVYRNCGIFIEAPMFNLVLCLALSIELAFRENRRKIVIAMLVMTILSTFSTTGIIFLIAICAIYIYETDSSRIWEILKVLIFPIMILSIGYLIYNIIILKMQSNWGAQSYSIRLDHLVASIQMWMNKPILGYGYANNEAFYEYANYDQGYSVGLPMLLARNGILIISLYITSWFKRILYAVRYKKRNLYFWIGSFILFFFTASVYKTIFIFLLCIQLMWEEA